MRKHLLWILPALLLITGCNSRLDDYQQFQFRRVSYLLREFTTNREFSFQDNGYTYSFSTDYNYCSLILKIKKNENLYLKANSVEEHGVSLVSSSPKCRNDPATFSTSWFGKINYTKVFTNALDQAFNRLTQIEKEHEAKKREIDQLFRDAYFVLRERKVIGLEHNNLHYRYVHGKNQKIKITVRSNDGSYFKLYSSYAVFFEKSGKSISVNLLDTKYQDYCKTLFIDALKLLRPVVMEIRKEKAEKAKRKIEEKAEKARRAKQLRDETNAKLDKAISEMFSNKEVEKDDQH